MALPVAQIMNQLQRGVREERIDVDDNDEEAMADVEDGAIVVQAEEEGEGSHWREAKRSNREEKEKLKKSFLQFREKKEKP